MGKGDCTPKLYLESLPLAPSTLAAGDLGVLRRCFAGASRFRDVALKGRGDPPFRPSMRSTVRRGVVALGFMLSIAGGACTPGAPAYGLADETQPGGLAAPFGPAASEPVAGAPSAGVGVHRYQTTASVGDFLQITIDKDTHTASYVNKTNGLTGQGVPYTVDAKGAYAFADPNGHLKAAIELEDHALVVDVDKAGPNKDTRALAIGAATLPISATDLGDRKLNMMQFRTKNGGMEVGNVTFSTRGNGLTVDLEGYWPRGAMASDDHPFHVGRMGTLPIQEGPGAHDFLTLAETQRGVTSMDYVFKTATGFAIDMSNGNIVMLDQPASKELDAASAGTYRALAFGKRDAEGGADDQPEPGESKVGLLDVTVSASGHLVALDDEGATVVDGKLRPVPDVTYLTGAGKLDPAHCKGIFTFRTHGAGGNRDVFVIFTKNGLLISSFTPRPKSAGGQAPYDYFYGAAVKLR